ncbi:MAG: hypothetical protein ACYCTE_10520 [Acidimicrobiales bacterium]
MTKRTWKIALGAFSIGFLLPLGAAAAYAAVAYGTAKDYGPIDGWSYFNQAAIQNTSPSALTEVGTQNGSFAPSGYMGAWAALYESNGALCTNSTWIYNAGSSSLMSQGTSGNCGSGNYYSDGTSSAYNGSGYYGYNTYESPQLTY